MNPATTFRSNVAGDAWNYEVETINFGIFGSYHGTLTEALTDDTYGGSKSLRFTETFNLQLQTGPAAITSYEELSPSGALLAELDNGTLTAVKSDTFSVPTPLSLSTDTTGVITLADGTSFAITYKIVGKTQLSTPAGSFSCWVVHESVVHSNGTTDAFTIWVAPETGNYVQVADKTVNPDGTGYQYTASLTSIVTPNAATVGSIRRGIGFALPPF